MYSYLYGTKFTKVVEINYLIKNKTIKQKTMEEKKRSTTMKIINRYLSTTMDVVKMMSYHIYKFSSQRCVCKKTEY
jgi:hypothetical protein